MYQKKFFFFVIVLMMLFTACSDQEETAREPDNQEETRVEVDMEESQTHDEEEQKKAEENDAPMTIPEISAPDVSPPKNIQPPEISAPEVSVSVENDSIIMEVPDDLLFDFDDATLREDAKDLLAEISKELEDYSEADVEIHGHTDNQGDPSYNKRLSEDRAKAVESYFQEREELDHLNFITKGFGETKPLVSNDTEENRAKNRRVEMIIHPNDDK
ncbi:OmpA family protein [Aliibacillus thermotolerans]|uniref:OmpA family protein n=1 Tax=Aliibacillus thermotolerans TaxID=1834418 RepID=A0ABW0U427_9BACI|nr:OmpA family protein [Aliibacillus thermotolerans]MDA3129148.1 OmpA family protein [Aliibacillus thermotolerans]